MFHRRSVVKVRARQMRQVAIETLENRQLMSATAAAVTGAESVLPAAAVKAAILGPSAAEGKWKGDAVQSAGGNSVEVKIVISSNKAEFITNGDTFTASLSRAHFIAIRRGTFDVTFTLGSSEVTVTGTLGSSGLKISGTFETSTGLGGTIALKKYSTAI